MLLSIAKVIGISITFIGTIIMKKNQVKSVIKASTKQGKDVVVKEVILSDVTKSSLNEIVTSAINVYDAGIKKAEAVYLTAEKLALSLGTKPTYADWNAQFSYVEREIVARRKISVDSAQNILSEVRKTMLTAFELDKPSAPSRTAEANRKARAKFKAQSVTKLLAEKEALAKSGDAESLRKALTIQKEVDARKKAEANEAKKNEGKALTKLKTSIKTWVSGLSADHVATLVHVKNNFSDHEKLAKKQ
jgi:hypothetical protein